MQVTENETELEGEQLPADPETEGSSTLENAVSGVAGLLLGSTIVYFALPYCISC